MKLTQTERKDIVAALQSGNATTTDLSRKYSVSRGYVAAVYRKDTGTLLKRLTQAEKEAIVAELLAEKSTVGDLAARYEVTPSAISYLYKKRMGRPRRPYPLWKLSSQEKETIVAELLAKKATIAELATRFGVPRDTISKVFRKQTGKRFGASRIPSTVKETLIEEIRTNGKVTKRELAEKYHIHVTTLERILKQETGQTFRFLRSQLSLPLPLATYLADRTVPRARKHLAYRAWHREEKQMYPVVGIDWYHRKVLIPHFQGPVWHAMKDYTLMPYSELRDRTRAPEYPKGRVLCAGDIVQFLILLRGKDGVIQKTITKATVTFDRKLGMFLLPELDDDPLAMYSEECEIIGTVYENPELIPAA